MKFDNNPYYSPELCGLKIIYEVDTADSYEFNKLVVWEKLDDKTIWWDTDSGCSCPSPFDNGDHSHDLKEITSDTYYNFRLALTNHSGIKQEDIINCESKLKSFVREHKLNLILK